MIFVRLVCVAKKIVCGDCTPFKFASIFRETPHKTTTAKGKMKREVTRSGARRESNNSNAFFADIKRQEGQAESSVVWR
jgi:hypothetical protein